MAKWLIEAPEDIWPDAAPEVKQRAKRWIDQAERLICARAPNIEQRIEQGLVDRLVVADIVEAMVTRAIEKTSRGGLDKLAYPEVSMEWAGDGGAGQGSLLYLTLDELMIVAPQQSQAAFTIRPRGTPPRAAEGAYRL